MPPEGPASVVSRQWLIEARRGLTLARVVKPHV